MIIIFDGSCWNLVTDTVSEINHFWAILKHKNAVYIIVPYFRQMFFWYSACTSIQDVITDQITLKLYAVNSH